MVRGWAGSDGAAAAGGGGGSSSGGGGGGVCGFHANQTLCSTRFPSIASGCGDIIHVSFWYGVYSYDKGTGLPVLAWNSSFYTPDCYDTEVRKT